MTESKILTWLLGPARKVRDLPALMTAFCAQLEPILGIEHMRLMVHVLHPQIVGMSMLWTASTGEMDVVTPDRGFLLTKVAVDSPFNVLWRRDARRIRRRLVGPGALFDYPMLTNMHASGVTDFYTFSQDLFEDRFCVLAITTQRAEGFSDDDLALMHRLCEALALHVELHTQRMLAQNVLQAYVGGLSAPRVLAGQVQRGDVESIDAVIWFSDLRNSTALSIGMAPRDFLTLMNTYFDAVVGPVSRHGGEILRFIGDAALAIFPFAAFGSPQAAAQAALRAAREARASVAAHCANADAPCPAFGYGIGLHAGPVLYGNIGTALRVEFSVIGAAANIAARVEGLCKTLQHEVLLSGELAQLLPVDETLLALGEHHLRDIDHRVAIHAMV
jgi:adenylate cyclase